MTCRDVHREVQSLFQIVILSEVEAFCGRQPAAEIPSVCEGPDGAKDLCTSSDGHARTKILRVA